MTNVMELSSIHNKLKALAESTNHEGTFPLNRISQQETHSEVGQTNKPAYCAFCRKMSTELKRCTKCKKVSYCNRECQAQHWKKQHKRECFVSAEHVPNTGWYSHNKSIKPDLHPALVSCYAFCQNPSIDLRKCTGCEKVFSKTQSKDCHQECQKHYWKKEHKLVCNKRQGHF